MCIYIRAYIICSIIYSLHRGLVDDITEIALRESYDASSNLVDRMDGSVEYACRGIEIH